MSDQQHRMVEFRDADLPAEQFQALRRCLQELLTCPEVLIKDDQSLRQHLGELMFFIIHIQMTCHQPEYLYVGLAWMHGFKDAIS